MKKIVLPNGARIVYEKNDFIKSVTFGIWVGTGSRHEKAGLSGASHFIEHMLFKGTEKHSCAALSEAFDELGGHSNAYTTKEMTAFYIRSLDDRLHDSIALLTEMIFMPAFEKNDVDHERNVIEEEISMYKDDPEQEQNRIDIADGINELLSIYRLDTDTSDDNFKHILNKFTHALATARREQNDQNSVIDAIEERVKEEFCIHGKRTEKGGV